MIYRLLFDPKELPLPFKLKIHFVLENEDKTTDSEKQEQVNTKKGKDQLNKKASINQHCNPFPIRETKAVEKR